MWMLYLTSENNRRQTEKKMENCQDCIDNKAHLERKRLARKDYHIDKKLSENKENRENLFFSLDLQKVRMLPEIPGVKAAVFTQRIAADNESFSPIGEKCGDSIGVIWHQGVASRNDEDIVSCWVKFVREYVPKYVKTLTVWMDNCGPQNKNWTIFPGLISIVNSKRNNLQAITMKFFEVGHTYMSADSFHHRVEKAVKQQGYLYDFGDYEKCINAAGRALVMEPKDFLL